MLTLYTGCGLTESLTFTHHTNFTLFPTLVYTNLNLSKPRKNWGFNLLFKKKYKNGIQQLSQRAQISESEFDALDSELVDEEELDGPQRRFREKGEDKDYDRDPEFAEILGSCLDDPDKARSKVRCLS